MELTIVKYVLPNIFGDALLGRGKLDIL